MPQFSSAPNAHARETMLRLDERQRVVLADKMADMANLVAAALVVGFAIGEPAASARVAATAIGFWVGALAAVMVLSRSKQLKNAMLLFGGLVAASWMFVLYDWVASRVDRKKAHGRA